LRDLSHKNLALEWNDDFLYDSVLFKNVWVNGTHILYHEIPKSYMTNRIDYQKHKIVFSEVIKPFIVYSFVSIIACTVHV
jgi:hypothetical protein